MALTAGTRLGPYEIVGVLGAGGMGEVYRARDPRLRRDVSIKVLPSTLTIDPQRLQRFEPETHAAAALAHPNILAVYDVGRHEPRALLLRVRRPVDGRADRRYKRAGSRNVGPALSSATAERHDFAPGFRAQYDVTRDGQRFLLNLPVEDASAAPPALTVLVDWMAALKK